jgi:hypothetical protein
MSNAVRAVLLHINTSNNEQETSTPTDTELKEKNLGIDDDALNDVNDGTLDIYKIEIVNGAIQVRRLLVEDSTDEERDGLYDVSDWELV